MALYHLSVKTISRGKGQSGVSALAYRAGVQLVDQRLGKTFDYQNKAVQRVELLLPDHVPDFMKQWQTQLDSGCPKDRQAALQKFSDYIESFERRMDSQIYREIEFALPCELTEEQNIKLAREFVEHHCCNRGMVAVCNFHFDVDKKTGQLKPHCHVLLSTRNITREGFGLKNRDWNHKDLVLEWREKWCEYLNCALKEYGIDARVDHRSYADRGIDIEPQLKKSHAVMQRVLKGLDSFRFAAFEDIRRRNLFKIQSRPELVLELVSQNQSTFTDKDILRVIGRYADSPEVFSEIQARVFNSLELVQLQDPEGAEGKKKVYTTRSLIRIEAALIEQGQRIAARQSHGVLKPHLATAKAEADQELAQYGGLSSEQKTAIDHLVTPGRLKTLVGYAGSGKTTALKVAANAWKETGYKVLGLAPTGRASENLEELGIRAMTLDRFFLSFGSGREQYGKGSVFIVDEAGMVDSRKMGILLNIVERQGVKLVLVGDKGQLQAVQAGPPFRMLLDRVPPARLENIIRQKKDWQRQATKQFGNEQAKAALQAYQSRGHIKLVPEVHPLVIRLKQSETLSNTELIQAALITRRIAGNIFYQIRSDLLHQGIPEDKIFANSVKHQHFPLFQSWKGWRDDAIKQLKLRGIELEHSAKGVSLKILKSHQGDLEQYQALAEDKIFNHWKTVQETALTEADKRALTLKSGIIDLRSQTKQQMAEEWLQEAELRAQAKDTPASLMLAHSNKDVDDLNRHVRGILKQRGEVAQQEVTIAVAKDVEVGIHGTHEKRQTKREYQDFNFAVGDQIIFKRNDHGLGVKNGTLGVITAVNENRVKVLLQGDDNREISFAPALYPYFRHGWAVTINASQGTTVDHVKMLASFEQSRNLSYVGFTRHRENFQIYGSELEFNNQQLLVDRLARSNEKLTGVDYSLEPEELQKVIRQDDRLITKVWQKYERAKDTVNASVHFVRNLFNEPQDINKTFGDASRSEPERAIKVLGIDGSKDHVPAHLLQQQKAEQQQNVFTQEPASLAQARQHPQQCQKSQASQTIKDSGYKQSDHYQERHAQSTGQERHDVPARDIQVASSKEKPSYAKSSQTQVQQTPKIQQPQAPAHFDSNNTRAPAAKTASYYDVDVINDLIKGNEEQLLTHLLGQKPNVSLSTSQEFRFGAKEGWRNKVDNLIKILYIIRDDQCQRATRNYYPPKV